MSRTKNLIDNTLVFALTNLISKFLGFLMLPFYTSMLSTGEFGTADLIITTVGLLTPLFTLSITNASMRFALDNVTDNKNVFTISLKILILGFIILLLLFPVFNQIEVFKGNLYLFYLLYLTSILQTFFNLFSRGIGKVKNIGISTIFNSIAFFASNIVFLYFLEMKIDGFLLSLIVGNFVGATTLFLMGRMDRYFSFKVVDKLLLKEMTSYSVPLIPNALSWWVNNTSSRYIIGIFTTVSEVGLYSAAARMPSILTAFQGVFVQAWQISAITEYNKADNIPFFSKVYNYYSTSMIIMCSFLIVCTKYIALFLFAKDFYEGWSLTPLLLVSVVFGSMVGFYSSFYLAQKKTKKLFYSTFIGALITIIFNICLIPLIGLIGSSFANVIAYFSVWLFLHIDSQSFLKLEINFRHFYLLYALLFFQAVITSYILSFLGTIISLGFLTIIVLLSFSSIKSIFIELKNKFIK